MILSTLLSVTGEPAGAEPAIRAVINATDASRIISINPVKAEAQGHHPDINFGWGYATVSLRTKKIARERFHHGCEDRWHLRARGKGLSSRFLAAPLVSFPSWRGLARNSAVHRLLPHLGRAIFSQSTAGAGGSPLDSERFRSIPRT
jgi:hypothetical protein